MSTYTAKQFEQTLLELLRTRPFYGCMVQQMNTRVMPGFPTAGIAFDARLKKFDLYVGTEFMASLSEKERAAILIHELQHITHRHVFYDVQKSDRKRWNIAMDLVINQNIANLPKEALFVENFKDKNGVQFPLNQTTEEYYDLLDGASYESKGDGKGQGVGQLSEFDEHNWDGIDKEEAMQAAKGLIERTLEKTSMRYSKDSTAQKDMQLNQVLSEELSKLMSGLDYKKMLQYAIRKSLPSRDRMGTWTRPNRRFGYCAQGKKASLAPKVKFYLDTSGSISINEFKEALGHCDSILSLMNATCDVAFFHTNVYGTQKMKKGTTINYSDMESGGTELTPVIEDINKSPNDLFIVITDGCYGDVGVETNKKVIFLISKHGAEDHPLKRMGRTVKNV